MEAIGQQDQVPPNGITVNDLCVAKGIGQTKARQELNRLVSAGKAELVRVRKASATVHYYVLKPDLKDQQRGG